MPRRIIANTSQPSRYASLVCLGSGFGIAMILLMSNVCILGCKGVREKNVPQGIKRQGKSEENRMVNGMDKQLTDNPFSDFIPDWKEGDTWRVEFQYEKTSIAAVPENEIKPAIVKNEVEYYVENDESDGERCIFRIRIREQEGDEYTAHFDREKMLLLRYKNANRNEDTADYGFANAYFRGDDFGIERITFDTVGLPDWQKFFNCEESREKIFEKFAIEQMVQDKSAICTETGTNKSRSITYVREIWFSEGGKVLHSRLYRDASHYSGKMKGILVLEQTWRKGEPWWNSSTRKFNGFIQVSGSLIK